MAETPAQGTNPNIVQEAAKPKQHVWDIENSQLMYVTADVAESLLVNNRFTSDIPEGVTLEDGTVSKGSGNQTAIAPVSTGVLQPSSEQTTGAVTSASSPSLPGSGLVQPSTPAQSSESLAQNPNAPGDGQQAPAANAQPFSDSAPQQPNES